MRKLLKRVWFCFLLAALVWCGTLAADRQRLNEELVRLQVVVPSDSAEDQSLKLRIREAVEESLNQAMKDIGDPDQAKAYLKENLTGIEEIVTKVLEAYGSADAVSVSLSEEAFDSRTDGDLTLPAGIYSVLRVTVGEGDGENWWCVLFPFLSEEGETEDAEADAGFPDSLNGALKGETVHQIRFFLLDVLGKLENLLRDG